MSRPEVLRCAATELEDGDLRTLMRIAFDEGAPGELIAALRELVSSSDSGSEAYAAWEALEEIQSEINQARLEMAES